MASPRSKQVSCVAVASLFLLNLAWRHNTVAEAAGATATISWTRVASAPSAKIDAGAAFAGGKLYVISGYDRVAPIRYTDTVNVYDRASNKWSVLPQRVPQKVSHPGTASDGKVIYLAGGFIPDPRRPCDVYKPCEFFGTDQVWRFDPDAAGTDKFTSLPRLPAPRGSGDLALVGRTLHFFGGVNRGTSGAPKFGKDRKEQLDHWKLDLDNSRAGWQRDVPLGPAQKLHRRS
jgi:hypothetical protein